MSTTFLLRPPETATQRVVDTAPLAASRSIRCGGFAVPTGVLACQPLVERSDTDESRILQQFLADDPWSGMGSVRPGGWLLIARDDDIVVFGQREGEVGIDRIVTLTRSSRGYEATSMGSWDLVMDRPGERAEVSFRAEVDHDHVQVRWNCGATLTGQSNRILSRYELRESPDAVHFLLVSVPNPLLPATAPGTMSVGTGASTSTTLTLSAPLGARRFINDARVPGIQQDLRTR